MTSPTVFVVLLVADRVGCFQQQGQRWRSEPIQGEAWLDSAHYPLPAVLRQLNERFNHSDHLAQVELHVVADEAALPALNGLAEALAGLGCTRWQVLRFAPLQARVRALVATAPTVDHDTTWLCNALLPVLSSTLHYADEAVQAERAREQKNHEDTLESVQREVKKLAAEKHLLQAQIAALARPSMARLLTFLPALYVNFWGVVRPDELALLVGELEIPAIPSPYLEPSADTLLALKKQLKALPDTDRSTLLTFCRTLPHKLTLRPEMREFFPD